MKILRRDSVFLPCDNLRYGITMASHVRNNFSSVISNQFKQGDYYVDKTSSYRNAFRL
jgi:hypothetical protein